MILSSGLTPEEQKVLDGIESDIVGALLEKGIYDRPFWVSGTDPGGRVVRLILKRGIMLELASAEIPTLSREDVLSRLRKSIEQLMA
jgi:hypothetical protein